MALTKEQLNTFLAGFKLSSTGDNTDVGKADIKRKMFAIYIKKAGDEAYEMIGYKQESVSVGSNYETEDMEDVTGASYSDIISKTDKIEMTEYRINPEKTKFLEEAIKLKISDQEEDMQDYTVLRAYGFYRDTTNQVLCTEEENCSVVLDNLGGQGFTMSDVTITCSGQKKYGTISEISANPTFQEYSPV